MKILGKEFEEWYDSYVKLKLMVDKRTEQFDAFIDMLENKTSWLTSPASSRYHLSVEGGLLVHSVGVAEAMLKLRDCLAPKISTESCVIVGLLHDVGKIGMPGQPRYLKNPEPTQSWGENGKPYLYNKDLVQKGLAVNSLYLITKYIDLSEAEAQAILYHDGQYIDANKEVAHREVPLTFLVTFADTWVGQVLENNLSLEEDTNYYSKERLNGGGKNRQ